MSVFTSGVNIIEGKVTLAPGERKTILESCCLKNQYNQLPKYSCNCTFQTYAGCLTITNNYSAGNLTRVEVHILYLGNPVVLNCAPNGIIIDNGHSETVLISAPFDRIELRSATTTTGASAQDITCDYFISLAVGSI
jgi:hypothetical protein